MFSLCSVFDDHLHMGIGCFDLVPMSHDLLLCVVFFIYLFVTNSCTIVDGNADENSVFFGG